MMIVSIKKRIFNFILTKITEINEHYFLIAKKKRQNANNISHESFLTLSHIIRIIA